MLPRQVGVVLTEPFRVITVCTGNICRSPALEQVLRSQWGEFGIEFSSAGTGALEGEPMPEQAQQLSRNLGGDPEGHRGRQVSKQIIEEADLVIALAREHRREIARAVPRASRYTFTLRELARVLESVVDDEKARLPEPSSTGLADTLRAFVPVVAGHRGYAEQPADPKDDDVVDPFHRSQEVYDRAQEEIGDSTDRIHAAIEQLRMRYGSAPVTVDP